MTVLFLADEDLDSDIIGGLRSREPAIGILDVKNTGLGGTADSVLLDLAAQQGRIVITHDRRTMTRLLSGSGYPLGSRTVAERFGRIQL
ncbi:MAG: DUF5615 family PIN-like protein [Acidobacteriia bacterium]|nr:DUF5615 family PIN-like protein [Terriglobia bacterium]